MAIQWGSYEGHLRVGIDISQSPSSVDYADDHVVLTVKYYVQTDGWNFSDTQTLTLTGNLTGTYSFSNTLSDDDEYTLVVSRTLTVNLTGSSQSKSFTATLSGVYNGATPSKNRTWTVPAQPDPPYTVPTAPGIPVLSQTSNGRTITATVAAPSSNGGTAITNYQFMFSTSPTFASGNFTIDNGTSRTYSYPDRDPNTTYYARARAQNSEGYSPWSSTASITTYGVPTAPATPTASATGPTSAIIDWLAPSSDGGSALTGYDIQRATVADFSTAFTDTLPSTITELEYSSLVPNTTYYFRVRAKNAPGDSPWSGTLIVTTTSLVYIKKFGYWNAIDSVWVKKSGVWVKVDKVFVKKNGVWKY